jgi:hypothetical protein
MNADSIATTNASQKHIGAVHVLVTIAESGFLARNAPAPYGLALAAVLTRAHCSCSLPSNLGW